MSTIIYPSPIFGPIHSRRLGISLGINLMPADGKVCTFDCIYCECGLNTEHRPTLPHPTRKEVVQALETKLIEMNNNGELPDVLTFAGNGEPTAHPQFADIIDDTILLRNQYCPKAKVSVLSNATLVGKQGVREALMRVDNPIMKLDTIDSAYIKMVDCPTSHYDVNLIIDGLKQMQGKAIIQTMFMTGSFRKDGVSVSVDNTGDTFVTPWLKAVKEIAPREVMIYTIDRETPTEGLKKASREQLDAIRDRVIAAGIKCSASY